METFQGRSDSPKETDLDRLAMEEIMKETDRAKQRAETMGAMGWLKCPLQRTNKRFLRNVVLGSISSSSRKTKSKGPLITSTLPSNEGKIQTKKHGRGNQHSATSCKEKYHKPDTRRDRNNHYKKRKHERQPNSDHKFKRKKEND